MILGQLEQVLKYLSFYKCIKTNDLLIYYCSLPFFQPKKECKFMIRTIGPKLTLTHLENADGTIENE